MCIQESRKEFIGYVPIMLRCSFCVLSDKDDTTLAELGECSFDQGGYFVINGRYTSSYIHKLKQCIHVFQNSVSHL
jgi:DNA-directed RNA polymerase beta subunit